MKIKFRYLFVLLSFVYLFNKLIGFPINKTSFISIFLRNHLNDFLYIPIVLIICLIAIRTLKKQPEFELNLGMICGMVIFSSVIFEYVAPFYFSHTTGDWLDVVMYVLGGGFYYYFQEKRVTKVV